MPFTGLVLIEYITTLASHIPFSSSDTVILPPGTVFVNNSDKIASLNKHEAYYLLNSTGIPQPLQTRLPTGIPENWGSVPSNVRYFSFLDHSDILWAPPTLLFSALSRGVKRPGRDLATAGEVIE